MKQTKNYKLPRWEETDRIMMNDFNDMTEKIDAGMAAAAEVPYVIGGYTGTGEEFRVSLGFRPRLLLLGIASYYTASLQECIARFSIFMDADCPFNISFTDDGFIVHKRNDYYQYPHTNTPNYPFAYIAFK